MTILIDNGHGRETPGKRSPDGQIKEYEYTREMAQTIVSRLNSLGLSAQKLVAENHDVPLSERCRRANAYKGNHILISLHLNAAGADGKWHNASGFSCFIANNASERSKWLAKAFTEQAVQLNLIGNRHVPPNKAWVQNLAICRDTTCPAVLTESLFMDNRSDAAILLSDNGFKAITDLHVNAILSYLEKFHKQP